MRKTIPKLRRPPEARIALVIGNSQYTSNKPLNNPTNDAQAVSQLLNNAGFEVVMAFDLARDLMKQTVEEFAARANEKGPNTVVLVYYAGHGIQVDGENFLIPTDAKFENETDLNDQGVKLAEVMGSLEAATSKMRIVILDACRNNPFGGTSSGLAIVDAPAGSIVAYSTAPGTEAFDGSGRHSPYAAAFMRTAKIPNLPIEQVFKKVRVLVNEATDTKQTPWESSSLTADFVFFSNVNVNNGAPAPDVIPARVTVADLGSRPAPAAYEVVIAEDSVEYYEEFVRLYPTDPRCDHIRRLLSRRQQMVAWQAVTHTNSRDAYEGFVRKFGNSDLAFAARRLQERPRVINIAFPRKGEGRFGDGRFGSRIDFEPGNNNKRPAIDFSRISNNGGRQGNFQNGNNNGGRFGQQQNGNNNNNNGGRFGQQQNGNNNNNNNGGRFGQQQNGNNNNNNGGRFGQQQNGNNINNNNSRVGQQQNGVNNNNIQNRVANLQQNGNNANNNNNNQNRVLQNQNQQNQGQLQRQALQQQQQQQLQRQQLQVQQQQVQRQQQIQQVQRQQIQQQVQRQQIQRQPQVIQRAPQVQVQRQNFQVQRQSFQAPRQSFSSGGGGGARFGGGGLAVAVVAVVAADRNFRKNREGRRKPAFLLFMHCNVIAGMGCRALLLRPARGHRRAAGPGRQHTEQGAPDVAPSVCNRHCVGVVRLVGG